MTIKRKASTFTVFVSAIGIIVIIVIVLRIIMSWQLWNAQESIDISETYYESALDKDMQALKHGFMKTAAFFSLHETFKELMEHGDITEAKLADADANGYADSTVPRLRIEGTGPGIPYWAHPGCMNVNMRLPYLLDTDPRIAVEEHTIYPKLNINKELEQYVNEVANGVYDLSITLHIMMVKKGSVEITGGTGVTMASAASTPATITVDGVYEYVITDIDPDNLVTSPTGPISIHFKGTNSSGGVDYVAQVNHMAITIYDNAIVGAQNTLFTQNLNKYYNVMNPIIVSKNAEPSNNINTKISTLHGVYVPDSFLTGIVWSDTDANDGITIEAKEIIGKTGNVLSTLNSGGLTEEETKLRHYTLDAAGEYLLLNINTIIRDRIYNKLNSLDDYQSSCNTNSCGSGPACPDDATSQYSDSDIRGVVQAALDDAEVELNAKYNPSNINWELIGPQTLNMGCTNSHTNDQRSSGSGPDYCTGGDTVDTGDDAYLLFRDHIKHEFSKSECSGSCSDQTYYVVTCCMTYGHTYILKNVKVQVKITDTKYNYYDEATKVWTSPTLNFYIMIDKVEDTDCDGTACGSIA